MKAILHPTTILSNLDQKCSTKATHNAAEPSKNIKMSDLASKNVGKLVLKVARMKAMLHPSAIMSDLDWKGGTNTTHYMAELCTNIEMSNSALKNAGKAWSGITCVWLGIFHNWPMLIQQELLSESAYPHIGQC